MREREVSSEDDAVAVCVAVSSVLVLDGDGGEEGEGVYVLELGSITDVSAKDDVDGVVETVI